MITVFIISIDFKSLKTMPYITYTYFMERLKYQ